MNEQPASARAATLTLGALLLLSTTSLVFSIDGPPQFQMTVSILIAGLKASLIAAVFMSLTAARTSMRLPLLVALVMVFVLVVFICGDAWTRPYAIPSKASAMDPHVAPAQPSSIHCGG